MDSTLRDSVRREGSQNNTIIDVPIFIFFGKYAAHIFFD